MLNFSSRSVFPWRTWRLVFAFLRISSATLRLITYLFSFVSLCLCGKNAFAFAFSAVCSLTLAATTAAAGTNGTAAALREQSAAFVSFQRRAPSHPPTQNVNSADTREVAARHFSG